jgi:DNA-directed RNA polymerase specialized sigma24 family protein
MTQTAEPIRLDERKLVHEAITGDTGAFEELCRRHAAAVWRFAHAVEARPGRSHPPVEAVREAAVDGMARALLTLERTTPSAVAPFRAQALTTVLSSGQADRPAGETSETSETSELDASVRATLDAFAALPLQWRAVIWLTDVEGLPQRSASTVLGLDADAVDKLADRARAGFAAKAPARSLRMAVHPVPTDLVDLAWQRWQALRAVPRGPFGLVLPGGRRAPAWIERTVAGAAAAVIALGITGAVALGGNDGVGTTRPAGVATEQVVGGGTGETAMGGGQAGATALPSLDDLGALDLGTVPGIPGTSGLNLPPLGPIDLSPSTPSAPVASLSHADIGATSASGAVALDPGAPSASGGSTGSGTPQVGQPTDPGTPTPPPPGDGPTPPPTTPPPGDPTPPPTTPPTTPPTSPPTSPPTTVLPVAPTGSGSTANVKVNGGTVQTAAGDDCAALNVADTVKIGDQNCLADEDGVTIGGDLLPGLNIGG